MAQEALHGGQVHAGFDQVRGEGVPQGMNAAFWGDAGGITRGTVDPMRRSNIDGRVAHTVGKQPDARPLLAPVVAQHRKQARREQRVAIPRAFALAHLDAHALGGALDVGQLQGAYLGQA